MPQPDSPRVDFERVRITASGAPENALDVRTSGGVSKFAVNGATGAVTASGGVSAAAGSPVVAWANGLVPPTTTTGTDTAPAAGTVYYSSLFVPVSCTLTGISVLNGTAVGTDKWIGALYDSAGAVVANSALAGITCSGTAAMQALAFTSSYSAVGPGLYFLSVSCNGTTARFRSQVIGAGYTGSAAGSFGTLAAITPPSTFTTNLGPIAAVY